MLKIRRETSSDIHQIRDLNIAAFGGQAEADLVDDLRKEDCVLLSLVAEIDERIVGHILFSKAMLRFEDSRLECSSLAPMCVDKELQNQGVGSALVTEGLDFCKSNDQNIIFVLGHPEFYSRFGFESKNAQKVSSPFGSGEAWMVNQLTEKALPNEKASIEYAAPFLNLL